MMGIIMILIAVAITAVVTVGVMDLMPGIQPDITTPDEVIPLDIPSTNTSSAIEPPVLFGGDGSVHKISSQEELITILKTVAPFDGYKTPMAMRGEVVLDAMVMMADDTAMFEGGDMSDSLPSPLVTQSSKTESVDVDHSTTNVQVVGVDEPDYLKNDGKYVYIASGDTLSIIDAYPAENATLILKIALDIDPNQIENMFLNNDRLLIFYTGHSNEDMIPEYDFIPRRSFDPVTHALIIDITDKQSISIIKKYTIDGQFKDARMIGNYSYFVTYNNLNYDHPVIPIITDDTTRDITSDAFYFDGESQFSSFTTLTAINIQEEESVNSKSFLMGHTGTFYVSTDNFYLTYMQHAPFWLDQDAERERFFEAIVPLLPETARESIEDEIRRGAPDTIQWIRISEIMKDAYNTLDNDQKEKLFTKIKDAVIEYDTQIQKQLQKTVIHKVSINEGKMTHTAKGSVPGRLLNQFSMDQNNDKLRVATTVEYHTEFGNTQRSNAVHVLDKNLDVVGSLGDIAPNESIFSTRFIQDRLYMVTFERIDPFFVIDLTEDTPKILGELKIPGFSDYLHPYDDKHIIGIGRDTKVNEYGRVTQLGVKIALFDASDVNNPKVADDVVIGDRHTYSAALGTHKAFYFNSNNGILSIPIMTDNIKGLDIDYDLDTVMDDGRWEGFYVFDTSLDKGFELVGTVNHSGGEPVWHYKKYTARTFHIGDILYTASDNYLKMYLLDENNLEPINTIPLKGTGGLVNYLK